MRAATSLTIAVALAAGGCRAGPGADELQGRIQAQLDEHFGAGLFEIVDLNRRGHYPYTAEADPREHLLIYYDAALRFTRDHLLSDWNKLNVGSLISVLGATPSGVSGVRAEGNRAGDLVLARGALAFARQGDAWVPTRFRLAATAGRRPASLDKDALPYRQHLKALGDIGAALQAKERDAELRALTAELAALLASAERRQGRAEGRTTIATGGEAGEYHRQGRALARLLSAAGQPAQAFPTSGSVENCRLVARGEVALGYTQNDIAAMASHGSDLFAGEVPLTRLRALCSLYPEAVHVVVGADSDLVRLADLRGRRVDIGPKGSGSRVNAVEVLAAAGIGLADLGQVQGKAPREALRDLEQDRVDALIFTSAFPAPPLADLEEETRLRLLPLDDVALEALRERSPHLLSLWIPEKTYPGMDQGCRTVGVTAMLVARDDTPAERVERTLAALFDNVDALARDSAQALLISRERAQRGVSIPMHPAAAAFFAR